LLGKTETEISEDTVPKLLPKMVNKNKPLVGPFRGLTLVKIGESNLIDATEVELCPSTRTETIFAKPEPAATVQEIVSSPALLLEPTAATGHLEDPTKTLILLGSIPKFNPVITRD